MKKSKLRTIHLEIAGDVLESIFKECDRYDSEETGGRVVGHYSENCGTLVVRAAGVIEPGPNAQRTSTSFFQDGDYQTEVFRQLEEKDPSIEHLGNWHTHHVNGYPTLSGGDIATYRRIVNHELHNLDFFYALLVTKRNDMCTGLDRYAVRHYVLFRGEDIVHEISPADVRVKDWPRVWPKDSSATKHRSSAGGEKEDSPSEIFEIRALDKSVLGVMYPSMKPRLLKHSRTLFWQGSLPLIDGSLCDIRVAEVEDNGQLLYYPIISRASKNMAQLCEKAYFSASHAVHAVESQMNRDIYKEAIK